MVDGATCIKSKDAGDILNRVVFARTPKKRMPTRNSDRQELNWQAALGTS
jgi:hypothetical protein